MPAYGPRESRSTLQWNFLQSPSFAQFLVNFCGCREHLLDCKWALLPLWRWLTDVLADLGRPLPTLLSALPAASVRLNKLSSPLLDKSLGGNSFNSFLEPRLSPFSSFQLRFYHLHLFYPYCNEKLASLAGFNTIYWGLLFWPTL